MERFNEQVLKTIEELANYFALETVQKLARNIRRRKLVNTSQLLNSLDSESRSDLARVVHVLSFAFEEYGRFYDMRSTRWQQQPPVEKILEWVKKRGVNFFGQDPYPYKNKVKTSERRMNEIAWGIARNRANVRTGPKRRPWFASTFYKSLNALQEEISLGVMDRSIEQMKETLLWRLKKGATSQFF